MPLKKQNVPVTFKGGIDQRSGTETIAAGELITAENVVHRKINRYQKRYGYTALNLTDLASSPVTIPTPYHAIAAHNKGNGLIALTNSGPAAYSESAGRWLLPNTSDNHYQHVNSSVHNPSVVYTNQGTSITGSELLTLPTTAVIGNYRMVMGAIGSDTYIHIEDIVSKQVIYKFRQNIGTYSAANFSGIATVGTKFVFAFGTGSGVSTRYVDTTVMRPDTVSSGATYSLSAGTVTTVRLLNHTASTIALVVYTTSGNTEISILDSSVAVTASSVDAGGPNGFVDSCVDSANGDIYVCTRTTATNDHILALNSTLATKSALSAITLSADRRIAVGTVTSSATATAKRLVTVVTTAATAGVAATRNSAWDGVASSTITVSTGAGDFYGTGSLLSGLYIVNNSMYVLFGESPKEDINKAYYLIAFKPSINSYGYVVSKWYEGYATLTGIRNQDKWALYSTSSYQYCTVYRVLSAFTAAGAVATASYNPTILISEHNPTYVPMVDTDTHLMVGGGIIAQVDGAAAHEVGFLSTPYSVSAGSGTAVGTGFTTAQTFSFVIVWEHTDSRGQRHQSAPSIARSAAVGTNGDNFSIVFTPVGVTNRRVFDVLAVLYMTTANGTIHYRTAQRVGGAGTVTDAFTIIAPPAGTEEILYTDQGILENIHPECTTSLALYGDRLVAGGGIGTLCSYSREKLVGEGYAFSLGTLDIPADTQGGELIGMSTLDERLIFFQSNKMSYLVGRGPDDTGGNNDFGKPTTIPSIVGALYPASIISLPIGVMFQSARGLYLLDRATNVQFIGQQVIDFATDEITAAVQIVEDEEVWFFTRSNKVLIFNYSLNVWSTASGLTASSACLYQGKITHLTSSSGAIRKQTSLYVDGSDNIQMTIETGWLSLAGLQGFQRIYAIELLGELISAHSLSIEIAYDFKTTYTETITWASSNVPASSPLQVRIRPQVQKCEAIKLRIKDASNSGGAFTLTGMTFEVGVLSGVNKTRAEQTV